MAGVVAAMAGAVATMTGAATGAPMVAPVVTIFVTGATVMVGPRLRSDDVTVSTRAAVAGVTGVLMAVAGVNGVLMAVAGVNGVLMGLVDFFLHPVAAVSHSSGTSGACATLGVVGCGAVRCGEVGCGVGSNATVVDAGNGTTAPHT